MQEYLSHNGMWKCLKPCISNLNEGKQRNVSQRNTSLIAPNKTTLQNFFFCLFFSSLTSPPNTHLTIPQPLPPPNNLKLSNSNSILTLRCCTLHYLCKYFSVTFLCGIIHDLFLFVLFFYLGLRRLSISRNWDEFTYLLR